MEGSGKKRLDHEWEGQLVEWHGGLDCRISALPLLVAKLGSLASCAASPAFTFGRASAAAVRVTACVRQQQPPVAPAASKSWLLAFVGAGGKLTPLCRLKMHPC